MDRDRISYGRSVTPATEEANHVLNEVLKSGRANWTLKKTVRFKENKCAISTRSYYHGFLPREDVNRMLIHNGDFLLRKTSVVDVGFNAQACLSVKWDGVVRHFIIDKQSNEKYCLDKERGADIHEFKTIDELIDFFFKSHSPFSTLKCRLFTPVGRAWWEFHHHQIELSEKLGEGMFGEVYSGYINIEHNRIRVAIKTLKCSHVTKDKIEEAMKEARLMRKCRHPNIVRFYGVAAEEEPLMLMMEYVNGSSLDTYLETNGNLISVDERIRMCCQAAFAIKYLHHKNILHRDIAARNCLYDREKCLKLSDFGLSVRAKKIRLQMRERFPVRWMPPEIFRTQIYTPAADIWALGVLIWEIFNNAAEPYSGWTGVEIKYELNEHNYRLKLPKWAPLPIQEILRKVWDGKADKRPNASQIADMLISVITKSDSSTSLENYKFLKQVSADFLSRSSSEVSKSKQRGSAERKIITNGTTEKSVRHESRKTEGTKTEDYTRTYESLMDKKKDRYYVAGRELEPFIEKKTEEMMETHPLIGELDITQDAISEEYEEINSNKPSEHQLSMSKEQQEEKNRFYEAEAEKKTKKVIEEILSKGKKHMKPSGNINGK